jgi:gliding motility-associated-like protein
MHRSNKAHLTTFVLFILLNIYTNVSGQQIIDSCFLSIKTLGKYTGSTDLANACQCSNYYEASDLMEWNEVTKSWDGKLPNNPTVDLPPPPGGCLSRAIWLGSPGWTPNGEAFALRLDKPLEAGKKYSFPFTYAADGRDSEGGFAPLIYTYSEPRFFSNYALDTLPKAQNEWVTNSVSFTATAKQYGHNWLIIHAYDKSGTVLSGCKQKNPIRKNFLVNDTTLCQGESILLRAPSGNTFNYQWNTGEQSDSIDAYEPGKYSVTVKYYNCEEKDSINLIDTDCEVRMTMPNVFTPNSDGLNELFRPIKYNYVDKGHLQVFNRWGIKLFEGDLFAGWNGIHEGSNVPTGPYYYTISYSDMRNRKHHTKGIVTIAH